jgi:hypothetical protein
VTQFTQGGANPAALGVPDLFVQVQAPPAGALPGAPSNIIGIVGSATWGPVNAPVVFGDFAGATALFGTMQARKYDLLTQVALAVLEGANAFVGVRVTDGTDVAASATVQTNCLTLTAKYTGTRGNGLKLDVAAGTAPSSFKLTLSLPGLAPESFDNLTGSGNAFWVAAAAAINSGQSTARGPSQLATATAGAGTTAPAIAATAFSGGLDGAGVTGTILVGADSTPRTGMYALRNTGLSLLVLADCDASATWSTQTAFAKSELCYAIAVSPAGDTISAFASANTNDDPWLKLILGDWTYFLDGVNNVTRLVSPQGRAAGRKAVLGPHRSTLNQSLNGVVATQSSQANKAYSQAELQSIAGARGDVVAFPSPGGQYFAMRFGRNTSSDPSKHQDNWTTMTNYLARSMGLGLGEFVGRLQTPEQRREAASAIGAFLQAEQDAGRIDSFSVQIDGNNNPPNQVALGVEKANVLVRYLSTVEYFLVDFTGGQTVTPLSALPAAA